MLRDFRLAIRLLASRPGFTFVAALSLALGIGANSAIFSLVDALWFRPMAVPDAGRIVRVFGSTDQDRAASLSYPEYLDLTHASTLTDLVAVGGRGATLIEGDDRRLVPINLVSPNFFTALGVRAALGRVFTVDDPGMVVVLGDDFWRSHYGADPSIVGRRIRILRIHEVEATVIGVLPRTFRAIETGGDRDLWFPLASWSQIGDLRELETRGNRWFYVAGRTANVDAANAELDAIARRMAEAWSATNQGRRLRAVPDLRHRMDQAGTNGIALVAIVLLVVMISSVNVANLLLSRAGFRGKEMAVRIALGASRARLVRQLMAENVVLGAAGLALGLAIGAALISILPSLIVQPPGLHIPLDFNFDQRLVMFSIAVSLATILFFGLAPAWQSTRPDVVPALKGEASASGRRWPLRNWLAAAQVAISMTLLACAGVLAESFLQTRTADIGFARNPLLLVWLNSDAKAPEYRQVIAALEALPGVRSVAAAVRAPLSLSSNLMFQRVTLPGRPEFANMPPFEIKYNAVTENFLSTMGTPILRGRAFDPSDQNAVLINEKMAQRFWPAQDAVGRTITLGGKLHTVIGVVKNAPINEVGEAPEPYLYVSYWANFSNEVTFLIETSGDAAALSQAARRALKSVDARLNPNTITTQGELIRYSAQRFQITAETVGALGVLGLILTAVGLYGVISYGVGQRTRELGIRMALGANRGDTLMLVLRDVAMVGGLGIAAGLPVALAATRSFSALLFGVSPWDARAFVIAAVLLSAVVLFAGFIPARRATAIDPSRALRIG
ncbi:MAG: ABC transporter permease [Acidobacteriia bacterium]|nr:ABC transporter permease [Terriglobia bacterium]